MYFTLVGIFALLATAHSRPQNAAPAVAASAPAATASGSTPIPIVNQTDEINPDGSFKYSYETGNGIKAEESGFLKDGTGNSTDKIQVIQGSVSYTDNEGKVINLKYIADENGFQPEGDHLPTAPPLSSEVAKSLSSAPAQPAAKSAPLGAPAVAAVAPTTSAAPAPSTVAAAPTGTTPPPASAASSDATPAPAAAAASAPSEQSATAAHSAA